MCDLCGKAFSQKQGLKCHIKHMHSSSEPKWQEGKQGAAAGRRKRQPKEPTAVAALSEPALQAEEPNMEREEQVYPVPIWHEEKQGFFTSKRKKVPFIETAPVASVSHSDQQLGESNPEQEEQLIANFNIWQESRQGLGGQRKKAPSKDTV